MVVPFSLAFMYTEHYLSLVSKFPVILKHSNHHGGWISYFSRRSPRGCISGFSANLQHFCHSNSRMSSKEPTAGGRHRGPLMLSAHLRLLRENQCQGWQMLFFLSLIWQSSSRSRIPDSCVWPGDAHEHHFCWNGFRCINHGKRRKV